MSSSKVRASSALGLRPSVATARNNGAFTSSDRNMAPVSKAFVNYYLVEWRAATKYVDVVQAYVLPEPVNHLSRVYELTHKPVFVWVGLTSQADSPLSKWRGPQANASPGPHGDQPTQQARGEQYEQIIRQLRALRAQTALPSRSEGCSPRRFSSNQSANTSRSFTMSGQPCCFPGRTTSLAFTPAALHASTKRCA